MLHRATLCLLLASFALSAAAQKKALPIYMRKAGETAIAVEVAKNYVAAEKPCDNYGWAAAVEMVLQAKQVSIPQKEWVMKAYGGYKCITPLIAANYQELQRYITDDYALSPNRKVHVETEYAFGSPLAADPFIAAFRAGEPLLIIWNSKPYVWYGVVYNEYIHPTGNRMFEITELKLLDPLAKTKSTQLVSFIRGKDDTNQIDGVMWVRVRARDR
ncbi:MAG TPA: hypothetical protein VM009_00390 [Terriglobales bacterium]|nr:hypothetical protein [Terriglobales bacterium]